MCLRRQDGPGAFEWGSESEDAIDRTLLFTLGSYASMSAVELLFPVGETYKFDLEVYDVNNGDPRQTFAVRFLCSSVVVLISWLITLRSGTFHHCHASRVFVLRGNTIPFAFALALVGIEKEHA